MKNLLLFLFCAFSINGISQEQEAERIEKSSEGECQDLKNNQENLVEEAVQFEVERQFSEKIFPKIQRPLKDRFQNSFQRVAKAKKNLIKKSSGIDLSGLALIIGLLVMISGFVFFILAVYTFWWMWIIGVAALILGFLIMCIFPAVEGGGMSWLGPILMLILAGITGGAILAVWGIVELIKWLVA